MIKQKKKFIVSLYLRQQIQLNPYEKAIIANCNNSYSQTTNSKNCACMS